MRFMRLGFIGALASIAMIGPAAASILDIGESNFTPAAGLITFSEFSVGTTNPTYAPATYGGAAGSPTVTFGGYFTGQSLGAAATCPAGAALTGCVIGNPTGPLTLDGSSPSTFITTDGSMPTSPVLSGNPRFNGPVAIEFSTPQAGVGLIGGYFDAANSTAITAYDSNGIVVGQVTNTTTGDDFLGLVTSDGSATISGLLFSLVGDEPAGFDVDNIRFGLASQIIIPNPPCVGVDCPEPASFLVLGSGLVGLGGLARLRRRIA